MAYYNLELNIISAENLKDVRYLARMQTYAVAWVYPSEKPKTGIDELGGVNPVWNYKLILRIAGRDLTQEGFYLTIEIYSNSLTGTKLVGKVRIPLLDLKKTGEQGPQYVNYPVITSSGKECGRIYMCYWCKEEVSMGAVSGKEGGGAPLQNVQKNGSPSWFAKRSGTKKLDSTSSKTAVPTKSFLRRTRTNKDVSSPMQPTNTISPAASSYLH